MTAAVPGCHGVAVAPAALGLKLGWLSESPPWAVDVELVSTVERVFDAELVWHYDLPPAHGSAPITVQTWLEPNESVWVGNTLNLSLRVDYRRDLVSLAAKDENLQVTLEALANIALPLIAQREGGLVLHASAVCKDRCATLLCAASGSGKSSLLMGLVMAGWEALSEDQCVLDVGAGGRYRAWPGPSWVRLKRGAVLPPLVAGRDPRFEAVDKLAWDLGARMSHSSANLGRIVLLEPPGGSTPVFEPVSESALIGSLTRHVTWFQGRDVFAAAVLPGLIKLAMEVPGFRMRIPRQPDWLDRGVALLSER